jgi:hypothetical protein
MRILSEPQKCNKMDSQRGNHEFDERMLTVDDTVVDDGIRLGNVGGDGRTLNLGLIGEGDGDVLALEGGEGLAILELAREDDSGDDCKGNRNLGFSTAEYQKEKKTPKKKKKKSFTHRGTSGCREARCPQRCQPSRTPD